DCDWDSQPRERAVLRQKLFSSWWRLLSCERRPDHLKLVLADTEPTQSSMFPLRDLDVIRFALAPLVGPNITVQVYRVASPRRPFRFWHVIKRKLGTVCLFRLESLCIEQVGERPPTGDQFAIHAAGDAVEVR